MTSIEPGNARELLRNFYKRTGVAAWRGLFKEAFTLSRKRLASSSGLMRSWLLTTCHSGVVAAVYLVARDGPLIPMELATFSAWFSGSSIWLLLHSGMSEDGEPIPTGIGPANTLTFMRLSLSPLLVGALAENRGPWFLTVGLVAFLAMTDLLDGQFARRLHRESRLGRTMDPMADLALLFCMAVALYEKDILPVWLLLGFVLRYPGLFLAALLLALYRRPLSIDATWVGKVCNATVSAILTGVYVAAASPIPEGILRWAKPLAMSTALPLVVNLVFLVITAKKVLRNQADIGWQKESNPLEKDDSKRLS